MKIKGGLGNQMFQYSFGRYLARKNNTKLKLDISGYGDDDLRRFSLDAFNISATNASREDVDEFKNYNNLPGKIIDHIKPFRLRKYFKYEWVKYDSKFLKIGKNAYLDSYWQSEKYFFDIRDILLKDFSLKVDTLNKDLVQKIINNDSVSLHVRRTDYITDKRANRIHGVCDGGYYYRAIETITKKLKNPYFFVFSDDIYWVKNNIKIPGNVIYVSEKRYKDYEELILMANCKHHIIANSSFSWWGAWLGRYKNKIIIAPQKWLNDERYNTDAVIPDSWIKI